MGQPGPHRPRLIVTSGVDGGNYSVQVHEGAEPLQYFYSHDGGENNPVSFRLTPDAIYVEVSVNGALRSVTYSRKDLSLVP